MVRSPGQLIVELWGGESAFFAEVRKRALLRLTRHAPEQSADFAQLACIKVWRSLDTFAGTGSFDSWLETVLRHSLSDAMKAEIQMQSFEQLDDIETEQVYTFIDTSDFTGRDKAIIEDILAGHSKKETAVRMGISHEALRSRIRRLRKKVLKP